MDQQEVNILGWKVKNVKMCIRDSYNCDLEKKLSRFESMCGTVLEHSKQRCEGILYCSSCIEKWLLYGSEVSMLTKSDCKCI